MAEDADERQPYHAAEPLTVAAARPLLERWQARARARAASLTTAAYFPNSLVGTVPKDADRYFGATVSVSF